MQKKNVFTITYGIHQSPFGWCVIGIADGAICQLSFLKKNSAAEALRKLRATWPEAKFAQNNPGTKKYINDVFGNRTPKSPINIIMKGTDFQVKVWNALLKIPRGKTMTYADIAKAIRSPKAVRAVGSACGKNPIPFIVPCHRVIASNGSLGGYNGGLPLKRAMLAVENSLAR